ncbi:MAG: hypothetical protein IKP50_00150 [Bacilli bacterium]|nr:hypothetical protein [Bacilli bacterium]
MALFDLPESRSNREADKAVVNKTTNKRSASIVMKGDGILAKISAINALVESKLGQYKNEYDIAWADNNVFDTVIKSCVKNGICAIDTETTGLNPISDEIVGMSIYTPDEKAIYIPIHHVSYITGVEVENQMQIDEIRKGLQLLVDNDVKIIMHNAKFDIRVIWNKIGIRLKCWFDTQLAAQCLNENEPHKLKILHPKYVQGLTEEQRKQQGKLSFDDLFEGVTFDKIPIKTGFVYGARDSIITFELYEFQLPYLTVDNPKCIEQELQSVCNVFWNIEMPFVDVIVDLEQNGISLDVEYAHKLSEKYHKILDQNMKDYESVLDNYKKEIEEYKKKNVNHKLSDPISVSSPKQLATLIYDILKVEPPDKDNPRGTGIEILEKIDNPLCKAILACRKTEKLLSTYIDKLPNELLKDGKIHCSFNQYGAKTGRLSSDNPNMQNIPSHNKDVRKMFVASPGNVLISCDFSQQEPRVMTAMCGDPEMRKAYIEGRDLYASIASIAYNVSYDDCLEKFPDGTTNPEGKDRRDSAKSIFLGVLYGRGINSIAEQLHTTKQKAQKIQSSIFKEFPAIKQFSEDSLDMVVEKGYVTTFWGRKRRLPDMQLPEYEFKWKPGYGDIDPLSFYTEVTELEVPDDIVEEYTYKLNNCNWKDKSNIKQQAEKEGIIIIDNGGKIADATRQVVNSRIQGSAADMSKIAGINISKNERLKELGFKLLVPIHDEYLGECPYENKDECVELFKQCMCDAAKETGLPIKVDVVVSYEWYGEAI